MRIIFFDTLFDKHRGAFETIDKLFLIFLLNFGECFNSLSSLLLKKDVFGICHLNEFLSWIESTRKGIFVDNESKFRFLEILQGDLARGSTELCCIIHSSNRATNVTRKIGWWISIACNCSIFIETNEVLFTLSALGIDSILFKFRVLKFF